MSIFGVLFCGHRLSTTSTLIQRAQKLHDKRQFAEAEQLLSQAIAFAPSDWMAYNLLALCLAQDGKRLEQATDAAEKSIQLAPPNYPWPHEVLSSIWVKRNQHDRALQAISQAIERYPNADYYAMASYLYFQMGHLYYAIMMAQFGLMLDPAHKSCLNGSRCAVERISQCDETANLIDAFEDNRFCSSDELVQRGWALLSQHRYPESQSAFADAIRLDNSNRFAQHSLVQAIVADNTLYQWASFAMRSSYEKGLIGYWPVLAMSLTVLLMFQLPLARHSGTTFGNAYLATLLLTWTIQLFFISALWLHPYGRLILHRDQIRCCKWMATILASALCVGAISHGLRIGLTESLSLGVMIGSLAFPLLAEFASDKPWARKSAIVVTAVYVTLCLATVILSFIGIGTFTIVWLYSLILMVICQMIDYFPFNQSKSKKRTTSSHGVLGASS